VTGANFVYFTLFQGPILQSSKHIHGKKVFSIYRRS
jgi:hypothetical protein